MKHFTPERYLALQNFSQSAMDAADANWEEAVDRYESYLETIRPEMPEAVRQLLDGFYLHDARVLSMGRRGDNFAIVLQLDVPPNDLLTIVYNLAGPPEIDEQAFPTQGLVPEWLHEEIELAGEGDKKHFVHSILFSNGWEVRLPFRDVQMTTFYPMFPYPSSPKEASSSGQTSKSA